MPDTAFPPVHPGEILLKEYLKPLRTHQNRLEQYFHDMPQLWLNYKCNNTWKFT